MSTAQPPYASAASQIHKIIHSSSIGIEDWPSDLSQQENRITSFQTCFFNVEEVLRLIAQDFNVIPPQQERKSKDDPIPTHTEMWICMFETAQSLTRASLLERLSFLQDRNAKKTVETLRPIVDIVQKVLENVNSRRAHITVRFQGYVAFGPRVRAEIAGIVRYQKWWRTYVVLKDVVESLYAALRKIHHWLVHKVFELQVAAEEAGSLGRKALGDISGNMIRR